MKSKPTHAGLGLLSGNSRDDDPLSGLANLFDIGIVFALGFMVSFISALNLLEMFNPESKVTITTEREDGLEITMREGKKTTIRRLTKQVGSGDGIRLGTAYRLEDGTVVYVPDNEEIP